MNFKLKMTIYEILNQPEIINYLDILLDELEFKPCAKYSSQYNKRNLVYSLYYVKKEYKLRSEFEFNSDTDRWDYYIEYLDLEPTVVNISSRKHCAGYKESYTRERLNLLHKSSIDKLKEYIASTKNENSQMYNIKYD